MVKFTFLLLFTCISSLSLLAQTPTSLNVTCAGNVTTVLGDDCSATLTPANLLNGDLMGNDDDDDDDELTSGNFTIVVQDGNEANGPVIDGCGRYVYTIMPAEGSGIEGFDAGCWGYVIAEDKTGPEVTTIPNDTTLICSDLPQLSLLNLLNGVSNCYQVARNAADDFTIVASTMAPALRLRLGLDPDATSPVAVVPTFFDACSDVIEVCVRDIVDYDINDEGENCGTDQITRVFTATEVSGCKSASGETNDPAVASFVIEFIRPTLDQVFSDLNPAAFIECTEAAVAAGDFRPDVEDYPYATLLDENFPLADADGNSVLCNLAVSYEDGRRTLPIAIGTDCPTNFKFQRVYKVIDWCDPTEVAEFSQIVKVGDSNGPTVVGDYPDTLTFSTNAGPDSYRGCGAFLRLDGLVTFEDACNDFTVSAVVYPNRDLSADPLGSFEVDEDNPVPSLSGFIPAGSHFLRFTAVDACGNITVSPDIPFAVIDRTAPVAICEDGLNISLTPDSYRDGVAIITPHNIDKGSYDDCSGITKFIARVGANDLPLADETYGLQVELTCADLGEVRLGLKVQDAEENMNFCWLNVLVEDKIAPLCFAPDDITLDCEEYRALFPQDATLADSLELNAAFGVAVGQDDCELDITVVTIGGVNSCGIGEITRTFTASDGRFDSADGCEQTITVEGVHEYRIAFPTDEEGDCAMIPDYDGLEVDEFACDLITTEVDVDTFRSTTADDFCFKLEVTYDVINWCEYNTIGQPYLIPRDGKLAEIGGVDRDPETEELYLVVRAEANGAARRILSKTDAAYEDDDDFAFLSRDRSRGFTSTRNADDELDIEPQLDRLLDDGGFDDDDNGSDNDDDAAYERDDSRGFFRYVQFIKIYDEVAPELSADLLTGDCDFGAGGADCTANPQITFTASDECTATFDLDNLLVELDADYDNLLGFRATRTVSRSEIADNPDDTYTVNLTDIPVGEHALRIQARDGCGNFNVLLIPFEVCADKAPTPICISQLTVTLMPTQTDPAGGGAPGGVFGMAQIWASDYIASPSFDCEGMEVDTFSIYTEAQANEIGFAPAIGDTGLTLTCESDQTTRVRIYAIDAEGNADYCQAFVLTQLFQEGLCEGGASGALAGTIATPGDELVSGVAVTLTGADNMKLERTTDRTGTYAFETVALGADYTLDPTYTAAVDLQRVKTSDIHAIVTSILGTGNLADGYAQVAADVTQDGQINVLDVVSIRRVILGLDADFAGGINHRFVRSDYEFDVSNYAATFPEVYNINNLAGNFRAADFTMIHLGDVVGSTTGRASLGLDLEMRDLETGDLETGDAVDVVTEVALSTKAAGFQGTLELAAGLELLDVMYGNAQAGNLNITRLDAGLIAISYTGEGSDLLTLKLRNHTDAPLRDLLRLNDRITPVEGVGADGSSHGLHLAFAADSAPPAPPANVLYQNTPNPVSETTTIRFELAAASAATLSIRDVSGRLLFTRKVEANAGANAVEVTRNELRMSGVLSYTVTAGDFSATRKMVVVTR